MRTSFDVLNAQQLLFAVRRDLAQARYGYVTSRLKLRSATGLLGEEDVQLVQSWLDK
jgi:outer membrane protein